MTFGKVADGDIFRYRETKDAQRFSVNDALAVACPAVEVVAIGKASASHADKE